MSRFNEACINGTPLGDNIYQWEVKNQKAKVFITRDEKHARNVFGAFKINEIGYMDNYYCNVAGHHWVILAENYK